jgi:hypothetical protein
MFFSFSPPFVRLMVGIEHGADCAASSAKGSLKNNFTFYTPMHPVWLRCESSEYLDIPAFSRLARRAPQRLKL